VHIEPVVRTAPTDPIDERSPAPPVSEPRIDPGSTFFIEIWASNVNPPLDGLGCVHVDLVYDPPAAVDPVALSDGVWMSTAAVLASFDDTLGLLDDLGGCQTSPTPALGVGEWVMVDRIEMIATDFGVVTITLSESGNASAHTSTMGGSALPPTHVDHGGTVFTIGDCISAPECDDGLPCTDDFCDFGGFVCINQPMHNFCSNGEFCDGAEICDLILGCTPGLPMACDDGIACTVDGCDEANDQCINAPDDVACADGTYCNGVETCDAVLGCQAGPPIACDDGVACTVDACNEIDEDCDNLPNDGACNDGMFCNGVETCDALLGCQTGTNPCPGAQCDEVGDVCIACTNDVHCNDGLFCNGVESCVDNICVADTAPCDDGNLCTLDACDEDNDECSNTVNDCTRRGSICDPSDGQCKECLNDAHCDDSVACTTDTCDTNTGLCVLSIDDAACDDGLFCNGTETCDAVLGCQAGANIDCDDNVPCTSDACDEDNDTCTHDTADAACDDGLFCNGAETCDAVLGCQAGADPCPNTACDDTSDACVDCQTDPDCDDGLFCNGVETCDGGTCVAGLAVQCDDGVTCTIDSCNEATNACANTLNDAACNNGLYCDGVEACTMSGCAAGVTVACDDGIECTVDGCDDNVDACLHDDSDCDNDVVPDDHSAAQRIAELPAVRRPLRPEGDHVGGGTPDSSAVPTASKRGGNRFAAGSTVCGLNDPATCQQPDQNPHGVSGTLLATSDTNPNAGYVAADTFTATTDGMITSACWWGAYVDFGAVEDCSDIPSIDAFTISYYEDDNPAGNLPGTLIAEFGVGGVLRTPTGNTITTAIGVVTEYEYTAPHLPVAVLGGSCYWIEIRNATSGECLWMWETAPAADLTSAQTGPSGLPYDSGDERDYDLAWCLDVDVDPSACGSPCSVSCDAGAAAEGEPTCGLDYDDVTNGGCNADTPAWTSIACPSGPLCGNAGNFMTFLDCVSDLDCPEGETCDTGTCTGGRVVARDTDWYEFTLTEPTDVTWTVTSDFEATIGILTDTTSPCNTQRFLAVSNAPPCQTVNVTKCLPAGSYTAYVAPARIDGQVPCGSIYSAELSCSAGTCTPDAEVCADPSGERCQFPNGVGNGLNNVLGATSDAAVSYQVADNFTPIAATTIDSVCWWGFYLSILGDLNDCGPGSGDDFTITYYDSDGTLPGAVLAGPFSLGAVTRSATGVVLSNGPQPLVQYGYTATHPPVALAEGQCVWIEIRNHTSSDDGCVWLWESAPDIPGGPGDSLSAQDDGLDGYVTGDERGQDMAWCVDGTAPMLSAEGCTLSGACCKDAEDVCLDGLDAADCLFNENGRFTENILCADLDPECKTAGCCMPDGSCVDMHADDCPVLAEPGLLCESMTCNAFGTCNWNNGFGNAVPPSPSSQFDTSDFYSEAADDFIFVGAGDDPCQVQDITWWVKHFNSGPGGGGCNSGTCDLSLDACDVKDPDACDSGAGGSCVQNSACTKTPDDYTGIRVTIYADAFDTGVLDEAMAKACNQLIPQGPFGPPACLSDTDCGAGEVCIDNDGDGSLECAAVCELVVTDRPDAIIDLDFGMTIEHPWQGDLVVSLEHVGFGPRTRLLNRPGSTTVHGSGFGPEGYQADHFGDIDGPGSELVLNDESRTPINLYDGNGPGDFEFGGPSISGGGADPSGVLSDFIGQPKNGTWRLFISDHAGGPVTATGQQQLQGWTLIWNSISPVPTGPKGHPEHNVDAYGCTIDADCIAQGCPASTTCIAGFCDDGGSPCGDLAPSGSHLGEIIEELELQPGDYSWIPYFGDDYEIEMDLTRFAVSLDQNRVYYLAIAPILPFEDHYQTSWMKSFQRSPQKSQRIFETLAIFPWQLIDSGPTDLGFRINGVSQTGCPGGTAAECCDIDGNNVTDDICKWCDCTPPCTVVNKTRPADMGGSFGACPIDGFCNIHDRNLALSCFAATTTCASINIDAGGAFGACAADGFCNVHDANHALSCFAGTNMCVCGPTPQTPFAPQVVDVAQVELVPSATHVSAGSTVKVQAWVSNPLLDLQSYQLHIESTGGRAGALRLVDISIAPRKDHVFDGANEPFEAFNVATQQMLAGRSGGQDPVASGYLATFTFRADAHASGSFVVDLRTDESAGDQTYFVADSNGKIAVKKTTPAVIHVSSKRHRTRR
jgi:hypothetical protein